MRIKSAAADASDTEFTTGTTGSGAVVPVTQHVAR